MPDTETYLTTLQVADLTGLRPRSVRLKCQQGEYLWREKKSVKNNKKYEIALSCLPESVQVKYRSTRSKAVSRKTDALKDMPGWKRVAALERFDILKKWQDFAKKNGVGTAQCVVEFCQVVLEGKYSRPTLYRWQKKLREGGVNALAPDWKNGKKPLGDDMFSPGAKKWVYDFYLHPNNPSMKLAYNQLKEVARWEDWKVPSYTSVKQLLNAIPVAVRAKHRKGKKYMDDRIYPYLNRDNSKLRPMQVIVADHHQLDIAVRMPDGRIIFPWITGWKDVRSNKILAWVLVSQPNSDSINISLMEMISKFGLGEWLLLDNGKDFRCRLFTGEGRKYWAWAKNKIRVELNESEWEGIYKELGFKGVIWAKPRNAKAKKIERFFKTVVNEFSVFFRSFRGRKVDERPEGLSKIIKKGDVVDFEELKKRMHQFIDSRFNSKRSHYGKGMEGRTPNQVFYDLKKTKRAVREEELALLMSKVHRPKQVRQNGIDIFSGWYWNDKVQMDYFGEKVNIRYIEDKLDKIYLFDLNWKFIDIASLRPDAQWFMNSDEYAKHMRYKKTLKQSVKAWEDENLPAARMSGVGRESLLDEEEIREPDLETKYVKTKYAPVVAAEALSKDKKKKKKQTEEKLTQIYADLNSDPFQSLVQREVDKFIIDYGRFS